ncbi:MAG: hypothetical protein U5K00_21845 [Melioribacteraceae bacterium]|nr:hypothetical protein [Melioribacteraceae bacterium]
MYFEHVYEKGLAQASYFIGCQATGEAIVIDPKRDIDTYLEIADRENMRDNQNYRNAYSRRFSKRFTRTCSSNRCGNSAFR